MTEIDLVGFPYRPRLPVCRMQLVHQGRSLLDRSHHVNS